MSLKVLKLEPWMIWSYQHKHKELDEMGYVETTPRFRRNGWYKHDRFSWFEISGKAFTHPDRARLNEDFDFVLEQYNHRPLTDSQRMAIKQLMDERLAPRSVRELYYTDTNWRELRSTQRHAWFDTQRSLRKFKRRKHVTS